MREQRALTITGAAAVLAIGPHEASCD